MREAHTILIIDDNPDDREFFIRSLKKVQGAAYRCIEAADGHTGMQIVNARACDCVLLDYSLPGLNGVAVLKALRACFPCLPVIFFTGKGNEEIAVQAMKDGAYDYLTKSMANPERLHRMIQGAISHGVLKRSLLEKDDQILEKSRALAASEERYELAVQGLSVGIWDWDLQANLLYWSQRFMDMVGCRQDVPESNYRNWERRLHPEDRERTLTRLFQHIKTREPYDVEYRMMVEEGGYIWIHAKGQAIWAEDGTPLRMVGSVEDITWRKKEEDAKEHLISKLMESNSDLERFAYVCSHDLQEPLRMISNFTQMLQRHFGDELDDKARHYMKYVTDGARHARELITDVLNYARVDDASELLAHVDSQGVLDSVLTDLHVRIEETGAEISHGVLPMLYIQPTHLRQLLQNLISNALKFCTEKPYIHIHAEQQEDMWVFSVRDNGIGIAQEHMHKLFIIFERLHHRNQFPGTGIGLAVCQKVVQKYGGRIWAESEDGKGSIFYFTLPHRFEQRQEAAA